jgi:hypothetical protein
MENSDIPYTDNREIMNDWNYDGSFTLTTLLVWDLHSLFVGSCNLTPCFSQGICSKTPTKRENMKIIDRSL